MGYGAPLVIDTTRQLSDPNLSVARLYLGLLGLLLIGYAFGSRVFAYAGIGPIFVGEIVLISSLFVFVTGGITLSIFRSPIVWAIMLFALWGALNTFPYIGTYGQFALRDAVLWAYSIFALIAAATILRTGTLEKVLNWYGAWLPWFLVFVPVISFFTAVYWDRILTVFPLPIDRPTLKPGDIGVHLAGAAAFLALGLRNHFTSRPHKYRKAKEWLWWLFWTIGLMIAGSRSRGALLCMIIALAIVAVFRVRTSVYKPISIFALVGIFAVIGNISFSFGFVERAVSPVQILDNLVSVVSDDSHESLQGTKEWRLQWWTRIVDYTVFGENFWAGKGYGINLAKDDGFLGDDPNLRSPHNGHLTVLARSGVVGLILWVALQGTVLWKLVIGHLQSKRERKDVLSRIYVWLIAYYFAFLINAGVDVYLEGPQGGIWFWCLIGFVIALTESHRCGRLTLGAFVGERAPQDRFRP